jgi:GNAT superfamily N-acetyltransferase
VATEIRRLGPGDGALLDAAVRAFRGFEQRADHACLADPGALAFVALDGDTVTGWAYGHDLPRPVGPPTLVCSELDVAPAARGGGVGRALLEAFAEAARARGATSMWVMTDVDAQVAAHLHPDAGGRPPTLPAGPWWVFAPV